MPRLLVAIPFIAVAASVFLGGHWYLAKRLVLDLRLPEGLAQPLLIGLGVLCLSLILQPIGERLLRPPRSRWIAWPASLWMGVAFLMLPLFALTDLMMWLGDTAAWALAESGSDPAGEGPGWARARAAGVVAIALLAATVGMRNGLAPPALRRVEIALARWPAALDGFRIVQISDVHIGPILGRDFARTLVERVNALEPDVVAVTGDLVDGRVGMLAEEVAPFADLRGRHGVFFVTGNHDHYSGAGAWASHAQKLGMKVLRNARVTICDDSDLEACFDLAGVDDHRANLMPGEGGEDLDSALADVPPGRAVLLLAHDPSTFKRASTRGIDLQISGHTHGGQIWPFEYVVRLAIPFVAGLYRRGDATLYVSRGTGFWGPPMRLRAPAEITELILRPESAEMGRT